MRRRSGVILCVALLAAGCGSDSTADNAASDSTAVELADTAPSESTPDIVAVTEPTTAPTTTTVVPATTTSTTLPETWHRDTEMAVRACLDAAMLGAERVEFMRDFDDDSLVQETMDLCDEAQAQLGVEDGTAAAAMAVQVTELNLTLNLAVLGWMGGEPVNLNETAELDEMFVKAFQAGALIP